MRDTLPSEISALVDKLADSLTGTRQNPEVTATRLFFYTALEFGVGQDPVTLNYVMNTVQDKLYGLLPQPNICGHAMTWGDLKKRLEGLPDAMPIVMSDESGKSACPVLMKWGEPRSVPAGTFASLPEALKDSSVVSQGTEPGTEFIDSLLPCIGVFNAFVSEAKNGGKAIVVTYHF